MSRVPDAEGHMRMTRNQGIATAAIWLALVATPALLAAGSRAGAPAGVRIGTGSVLWIEGSSNIHDWESRTTQMSVQLTRDSSAATPATPVELEALVREGRVDGLVLEVPVRALHSKKSGIDKNLWNDLKAEQHPTITFRLQRYSLASRAAKSDTTELRAEGTLQVAGQERPVSLTGRVHLTDAGLRLDGSHAMRMTEFGIKPRTMMLGTLRVRDEITVHYQLLLAPKQD